MKIINYFVLISFIALFFYGCGGDNSSNSGLSDEEKLALGWTNFSTGLYQDAIDLFNELIDDEAYLAEAYSGLGWSYSRTGQLGNSLTMFNNGLASTPVAAVEQDLYAGSSIVMEAQQMFSAAITNSAEVGTDYQFLYDPEITYNDIVLIRAICYYATAEFANSLLEVQILAPDFDCDTETEEGRAALADKIEELRGVV